MTTKEDHLKVLERTREILDDDNNWTTGELALDVDGFPVLPTQPVACKWCLEGALCKANYELFPSIYPSILLKEGFYEQIPKGVHLLGLQWLLGQSIWGHLWWVNDRKGYGTVMELLDTTIAKLKGDIADGN